VCEVAVELVSASTLRPVLDGAFVLTELKTDGDEKM
jgi:hypothetical protein